MIAALIARPMRNHGLKVTSSRTAEAPAAAIVMVGHHEALDQEPDPTDYEEDGDHDGEAQCRAADVAEEGRRGPGNQRPREMARVAAYLIGAQASNSIVARVRLATISPTPIVAAASPGHRLGTTVARNASATKSAPNHGLATAAGTHMAVW